MSKTPHDVASALHSLKSHYVESMVTGDDDAAISTLVQYQQLASETAATNRVVARAASRSTSINVFVEAATYYTNVLTLFVPVLDPALAVGSCTAVAGVVAYQCSLLDVALLFVATHLLLFPLAHVVSQRRRRRRTSWTHQILSVLDHSPLRLLGLVIKLLLPRSHTVAGLHKDEGEYLFKLFWDVQFIVIAIVAMAFDTSYDAVSNLWAILATSLMEALINFQRYIEQARRVDRDAAVPAAMALAAMAWRRELVVLLFLVGYLIVVTAVTVGTLMYFAYTNAALVVLAINAVNVCTLIAMREYPDATAPATATVQVAMAGVAPKDTTVQLPLWDRLAKRLHVHRFVGTLPTVAKALLVCVVALVYFMSLIGMLVVARAVVDEVSKERAIRTAQRTVATTRRKVVNAGLELVLSEQESQKRRQLIEDSLAVSGVGASAASVGVNVV